MTSKATSFELKREITIFCQGNALECKPEGIERICVGAHSQTIERRNPTSRHGELERTKNGLVRTCAQAIELGSCAFCGVEMQNCNRKSKFFLKN
jgi:hypothetical protein